jgi:hypothetical protein
MKRMTEKQFMEKYIWGLKNFVSHRQLKIYTNEISYRPEHKITEFLLPYTYPCTLIYNKSKDKTLLFLRCSGLVNLTCFGPNDTYEGVVLTFKGNCTDDILDNLLKSDKFTNLLKEEYFKYKNYIEKETA